MQWSLIAVVLIVSALLGASFASAENGRGQISSVFEAFGYSPACVASALTSCEFSSTKELSVDVVDSIKVTKSLLQKMKSERENTSLVVKSLLQELKSEKENSASIVNSLLQEMKSELSNSVSEMKSIRQEIKSAVREEMKSERENSESVFKVFLQELKSERENSVSEIKAIPQEMKSAEENSSSVVKSLLQEMKSEMKAIRQEMRSAEENSSSVVKSLLQEMKSEVKAIRQEMKSAEENSSSVVNSLLQEMKSEMKAIRQEMKSAEENSSSVVKSLLQEMKSEVKAIRQEMKSAEENSSSVVNSLLQEMKSEMKAIRQEMKSAEENSSSVVNSLLQEMKSEIEAIRQEMKSEIKAILQEVKRELENVTDSFQSRDCAIPSGTTATAEGKELPKNCAELKEQGETSSVVQTVYPYGSLNPKQTTVYCDQVTDGGGWTVIQSRSPLPIRENFTRSWKEYVEGFGDLNGEFWIGLDNIHALTNSAQMQLRIDLEDADGEKAWALYSTFQVGDAASEYVLRIGGYSGTAGDGMTYYGEIYNNVNGMKFSTQDNDNDLYPSGNCAEQYKGGWWYNACHVANLNGLPKISYCSRIGPIPFVITYCIGLITVSILVRT